MARSLSPAGRRQVEAIFSRMEGLVAEMRDLLSQDQREPSAEDAAWAARQLPAWFSALGAANVAVAEAHRQRPDTALARELAAWAAEECDNDIARAVQGIGLLLGRLSRCRVVAGNTVELCRGRTTSYAQAATCPKSRKM